MRFGQDWVSLGGTLLPVPLLPVPRLGPALRVARGSVQRGHRGQAQGTLPGRTALFFEPRTEEKRQCELREDRERPACCSRQGAAHGVQLPPTAGGRAGAPQNAGSEQEMLLRLTPFWGTGNTTSKRSPANACQPLPALPRS